MADMTREEAIRRVGILTGYEYDEYLQALNFAISDMERVEQLEAENKRLKEDLSRWQEGEWNNCEECCNRLAYKLAELRDGIEKAKAEIEECETYEGIYLDRADILEIIDKYLGE